MLIYRYKSVAPWVEGLIPQYQIVESKIKFCEMAKNKPIGDGARKGAVKSRSQVLNPKIGLYVKKDASTGRFMDVKASGGKFKGVAKEN